MMDIGFYAQNVFEEKERTAHYPSSQSLAKSSTVTIFNALMQHARIQNGGRGVWATPGKSYSYMDS